MNEAIWYFDVLLPFAYLQFSRLYQPPPDFHIAMKPILSETVIAAGR